MKNEERIIELLSEYLHKHDRLEDVVKRQTEILDRLEKQTEKLGETTVGYGRLLESLGETTAGHGRLLERLVDEAVGTREMQAETNRAVESLAKSLSAFVDVIRMQYENHEQRISTIERNPGIR